MAKLMMIGRVADVEITDVDDHDEDRPVLLTCVKHVGFIGRQPGCGQTTRARNYDDAVNWAESHADNGSPLS